MTPTATYIAEENCLQELPQWEAPRPSIDGIFGPYADIDRMRMVAYKKHLATLRKIPCDISCKGLWADGQKLVVGKDYGVRDYPIRAMLPTDPKFIAFPLVPVGEDELWREVLQEISNDFMTSSYAGSWIETDKAIAELKSKYSLNKR